MNPFTTVPKFIKIYFGIQKYLKNIPEFERLREEGEYEKERELIRSNVEIFCNNLDTYMDVKYNISGEENIPEDGTFMVYANHQSFADVMALLKVFAPHRQMGFVAKDEWRKIKILARGIEYTRSVFLKRGDARDAIQTIRETTDLLNKGYALTIFPEGTRSQNSDMGEFKAGALKFAQKAKVPILPITLDGGYRLYEEKHSYQPCTIDVTIHPLVHIEEMGKQEAAEAYHEIENTVRSALPYNS